MSSQTFEIGGVHSGVWVLQSRGGATVHSIFFNPAGVATPLSSATSTLVLYDNTTTSGNILTQIDSNQPQNVLLNAVLTKGLTASITSSASTATIVIQTTSDNPTVNS